MKSHLPKTQLQQFQPMISLVSSILPPTSSIPLDYLKVTLNIKLHHLYILQYIFLQDQNSFFITIISHLKMNYTSLLKLNIQSVGSIFYMLIQIYLLEHICIHGNIYIFPTFYIMSHIEMIILLQHAAINGRG